MLLPALEVLPLLNCLLAILPTRFDVCSFLAIYLPLFALFLPVLLLPSADAATLLTFFDVLLRRSSALALRATRLDVTGFFIIVLLV